MKSGFRSSFERDIKRVRNEQILADVRQAILSVEAASHWRDIPGIKKLSGSATGFRIRVSDYRIGLFIEEGCAEFVRLLPRRDIYRGFP